MSTRILAAVAALVSAAVHLWLWFDGVRDQDTIGELFMVNAIAGAVIAVLLVTWRSWIPLFLVAGFGASTLGAFIISTTVGLFDVHASWDGWDEYVAAAAEIVAFGAGAWGLVSEGWLASLRQKRSPSEAQH